MPSSVRPHADRDRSTPADAPSPLPPRLSPGAAVLVVVALSGALWFGLIRLVLALV